jgi:hypothetical protein
MSPFTLTFQEFERRQIVSLPCHGRLGARLTHAASRNHCSSLRPARRLSRLVARGTRAATCSPATDAPFVIKQGPALATARLAFFCEWSQKQVFADICSGQPRAQSVRMSFDAASCLAAQAGHALDEPAPCFYKLIVRSSTPFQGRSQIGKFR